MHDLRTPLKQVRLSPRQRAAALQQWRLADTIIDFVVTICGTIRSAAATLRRAPHGRGEEG